MRDFVQFFFNITDVDYRSRIVAAIPDIQVAWRSRESSGGHETEMRATSGGGRTTTRRLGKLIHLVSNAVRNATKKDDEDGHSGWSRTLMTRGEGAGRRSLSQDFLYNTGTEATGRRGSLTRGPWVLPPGHSITQRESTPCLDPYRGAL